VKSPMILKASTPSTTVASKQRFVPTLKDSTVIRESVQVDSNDNLSDEYNSDTDNVNDSATDDFLFADNICDSDEELTIDNYPPTAMKKLQDRIDALEYQVKFQRDVTFPVIKKMNKIFSSGQVEGQAHAYTEIPLGLTCEEWKQCYKLIFGRNDLNGNFYWKLFSVNGSTKGVCPGMNDPTIQYSCYQWFKAEDVSPFYTIKYTSNKVYLSFRDWFLQYYYPFTVSHSKPPV
jgi:hypothetical protein